MCRFARTRPSSSPPSVATPSRHPAKSPGHPPYGSMSRLMTTSPLLMIPGPTPVAPDVLAALAEPVRSHTGPENAASMLRIQEGIRHLVGSAEARVHCFAGAGTLAMEAAIVNHAAPGDRVVVVSHGYFGDRFAEIAAAMGMRADALRVEWGEPAR